LCFAGCPEGCNPNGERSGMQYPLVSEGVFSYPAFSVKKYAALSSSLAVANVIGNAIGRMGGGHTKCMSKRMSTPTGKRAAAPLNPAKSPGHTTALLVALRLDTQKKPRMIAHTGPIVVDGKPTCQRGQTCKRVPPSSQEQSRKAIRRSC